MNWFHDYSYRNNKIFYYDESKTISYKNIITDIIKEIQPDIFENIDISSGYFKTKFSFKSRPNDTWINYIKNMFLNIPCFELFFIDDNNNKVCREISNENFNKINLVIPEKSDEHNRLRYEIPAKTSFRKVQLELSNRCNVEDILYCSLMCNHFIVYESLNSKIIKIFNDDLDNSSNIITVPFSTVLSNYFFKNNSNLNNTFQIEIIMKNNSLNYNDINLILETAETLQYQENNICIDLLTNSILQLDNISLMKGRNLINLNKHYDNYNYFNPKIKSLIINFHTLEKDFTNEIIIHCYTRNSKKEIISSYGLKVLKTITNIKTRNIINLDEMTHIDFIEINSNYNNIEISIDLLMETYYRHMNYRENMNPPYRV